MENKEYEKAMQEHTNRIDPISIPREQRYQALYPLQQAYKQATTPKEKEDVLQELVPLTKYFSDVEEVKDMISETPDKVIFGNYASKSGNMLKTNYGQMTNKLSQINIDGVAHFEVDPEDSIMLDQVDLVENKYISAFDYKKILEKKKKDNNSIQALQDVISTINEAGSFNRETIFNNIKNNIISTSNLESLINDNIFGKRNFKEDFISSLMEASYEDLGLSIAEEDINRLDPTDDGKISLQDAIIIFGKLTEDEDQTIDYVAEYFTKFAEQNRTKPNLENQEETGYDPYEFA
tara:strand:+ start:1609 stop:2487 length:879 start_codon:yes stop_codon:yes gene_type:complete